MPTSAGSYTNNTTKYEFSNTALTGSKFYLAQRQTISIDNNYGWRPYSTGIALQVSSPTSLTFTIKSNTTSSRTITGQVYSVTDPFFNIYKNTTAGSQTLEAYVNAVNAKAAGSRTSEEAAIAAVSAFSSITGSGDANKKLLICENPGAFSEAVAYGSSISHSCPTTKGATNTFTVNLSAAGKYVIYLTSSGGSVGITKINIVPRKTIYMVPGNWNNDTPNFYVHSWGDFNDDVLMTVANCETNVFRADVPTNNTNLLFTRQDPSSTEIIYQGQSGNWNQSANYSIGSNNQFTFSGTWSDGEGKSTFNAGTYSAPTFTVTYDANGGTGSVPVDGSSPYSCGSNVTILGNTGSLTKAGKAFGGWNTASGGGGTSYVEGSILSNITGDVTLFAKWETAYSVTYNANGGSGSVPSDATPYANGATVTVLGKNTLTKTNCVFAGWNTADDGSGTWYDPSATFSMGSADVTLYAQWATCISGEKDLERYDSSDRKNASQTSSDLKSTYSILNVLDGDTRYDNSTSGDGYEGLKFKHSGDWIGFGVPSNHTVTITTQTTSSNHGVTIDFSSATKLSAKTDNEYAKANTDRYFRIKTTSGDATVINKITITPACNDAELAYATGTVTKKYGDAVFTNELTNSHSVSVTYSSSNTDVATVNSSTGAVTIKAAGTTTITATAAEQTVSETKYCADAVSYTLNVGPAVTVGPTAGIDGNYGYRYTIGETIDLTATVSGGSSYTYQWQKYDTDHWADLANGLDATDGGTFSGVTTARLQISDCTVKNVGSYRCQVTAGGQTNADAGYRVRVYTLHGDYHGGTLTDHAITWTGETTGTVTLDLLAKRTYTFKITDNDGKWYGSGENNYIIQPVSMDCGTSDKNVNLRLFTAPAGNYVFTIDIENAQIGDGTEYVNVSVAYPSVTHPNTGYVYLPKSYSWRPYLHYWFDNDHVLTDAEGDPQLATDQYVTICNNDYWCIPVIDYYCNFIARNTPVSPSETTGDQHTNSDHPGQCIYHDGSWQWKNLIHSISFDANGGSGTMDDIDGICSGGNQTLPSNTTITRDGWEFDGWYTNKYGKGGTKYTDGATIEGITSDITLYAQWKKTVYLYSDIDWWYNGEAWYAIYYWDNSATSNNGYVTMELADCEEKVYKATLPGNGYTHLRFLRMNPKYDTPSTTTGMWNKTEDYAYPTSNSLFTIDDTDGATCTGSWGTYSAPTYTISYNKGTNGTGTKDSESKTCSVDFTLPGSTFTYGGHAQDGWATSDGGTKAYDLSGSYTTNAAQTFYPHWKCNKPTISFNAQTKTVTISSVADATIYYTTNGDDPDNESDEYTAPFTIDEELTIKAVAIQSNCTNSDIDEETCTPCGSSGLAYSITSVTKTYGAANATNPLTNGNSLSVTYSTSNSSVADVDESTGEVTFGNVGTARITATWAGSDTYCPDAVYYDVTVNKADITPSLSYSSTTLYVGDNSSSPTVSGNTGSGSVSYAVTSSSPSGCITVDSGTGVVTAVAAGTGTVTATVAATDNYNGNTCTANFTVTDPCFQATITKTSGSYELSTGNGETKVITSDASITSGGAVRIVNNYNGSRSFSFNENGIAPGTTQGYVEIIFPTGTILQTGSVIRIQGAGTEDDAGLLLVDDEGETVASQTNNGAIDFTYTVIAASTINGNNHLRIVRAKTSSKNHFKKVTVTNCGEVSCTTSPTVGDGSNSSVAVTTATVTCASGISSLGSAGCSITSYGFVLGTSSNPTTSNTTYEVGTTYTSTGVSFSKNLTDLVAGTTYYVRPYATNGNGTDYGTQTSFTMHYAITTGSHSNGSVTIPSSAASGATVNISASGNTGYNFTSWIIKKSSDGTDVTSSVSLSGTTTASFTMPSYGVTIDATFTAKTYTVNLDDQSATTAVSPSSVTATYNSSTLSSSITNPSKTGYTFGGWYKSTGGAGGLIISTGGALQASTDYTGAGGIWTNDGDVTLYAKWTASVYTVTLNKDGGTINSGNVTSYTYGTGATLPTDVTKSGYTFDGWYDNSSLTGDAVTTIANDATGNKEYWAKWTALDGVCDALDDEFEYEAKYEGDPKWYSVVGDVTYSFTEWSDAADGWTFSVPDGYDANYLHIGDLGVIKEVKLTIAAVGDPSTDSKGISYYFGEAGELDFEKDTYTDMDNLSAGTLSLRPASGDFNAFVFKPMGTTLKISNICIYYTDYPVYTVSYNAMGGTCGTSSETTVLGKVTLPEATNSTYDLVWVESDGTEAGAAGEKYKATGDVTLYAKWIGDCDGEPDAIISITPTITKDNNNNGSASASGSIGGTAYWDKMGKDSPYKLNNDGAYFALQLTSGNYFADDDVLVIEGSDKAHEVYAGSHANVAGATRLGVTSYEKGKTIYYTLEDLPTNTSEIFVYRTSDTYNGKVGSMRVVRGDPVCYNVIYHGNGATGGYVNDPTQYAEDDDPTVLSNGYTQTGYEFVGWYTKASVDGTGTWYQPSSTISNINADVDLYAQWRILIEGANEDFAGYTVTSADDVRLAEGATLTIKSTRTIHDIILETGSTLNVSTNGGSAITFTVNSLHLKGGLNSSCTEYDMPRVYINPASSIVRTNSTINFDISVNQSHYYPIAVPFPVEVAEADYVNSTMAYYSEYGKHFVIKEYDGAGRAENGAIDDNWVVVSNTAGTKLLPGKGYILTAISKPAYGGGVIRFPMKSISDDWLDKGEQATVDEVTKNEVTVTAHTGKATEGGKNANKGWNMLGVPYMSCFDASDASTSPSDAFIKGKLNFITGEYKKDDDNVYVTVPTSDFSEYIQKPVSEAVLLPGWCFFVQVSEDATVSFATAGQEESSSLPIYARREETPMPTVKTGIVLSSGTASDKTTFLISDKYSAAEYEINADLEKMFGNGYTLATYSLGNETRLAYNAMSRTDATNVIPIGYRAPAEGEYTFAINPRYAENGDFERIDLIDYETGFVTNLLQSSYTFTSDRTQSDSRFALNVVPQKETPTDIEPVSGDGEPVTGARKVIINDKLYIILNGKMYDAKGVMVK